MAKSTPSLSDAIRAAIPPVTARGQPWWKKIPAEVLAELEQLRDDWYAGRQPGSKTAVARAISEELTRRKLSDVQRQGVVTWLNDGKPSAKR